MWFKIDFEKQSSAYMNEKYRKIPNCDEQFLEFINKYSNKISDFRLLDRSVSGDGYSHKSLTLFYESDKELKSIKYE